MTQNTKVGTDLLSVPFPEMVAKLAISIGDAQKELDLNSIVILNEMGNEKKCAVQLPIASVESNGTLKEDTITTSMIGAGFQPTFYQFAETIIEVKMTITATQNYEEQNQSKGNRVELTLDSRGITLSSTPINANYTNKYNYTAEGISTLRTRLVPMPPNTVVEKYLEMRSHYLDLENQAKIAQFEAAIAKKEQEVADAKS